MYVPASFRVDDLPTLHAFMLRHSFATLVTAGAEPYVTHLPLLLDPSRGPRGTIVGHVARANPHWQIDHARAISLAIFHGPHAYISPAWYRAAAPAVPTWNYAVVHAWGHLSPRTDPADVTALLDRTVETYESTLGSPWQNRLPPAVKETLAAAVVAFEMPIERLEGKFKLGQNRAAEDQLGALEALESTGDPASAALAALTRTHLAATRFPAIDDR